MAKERDRIDDQGSKTTPGIGTDIFIRKKAPGAHVGEGYIVDIYENGVKTDSFEMKNKKDTIDLIKLYQNLDRNMKLRLRRRLNQRQKSLRRPKSRLRNKKL